MFPSLVKLELFEEKLFFDAFNTVKADLIKTLKSYNLLVGCCVCRRASCCNSVGELSRKCVDIQTDILAICLQKHCIRFGFFSVKFNCRCRRHMCKPCLPESQSERLEAWRRWASANQNQPEPLGSTRFLSGALGSSGQSLKRPREERSGDWGAAVPNLHIWQLRTVFITLTISSETNSELWELQGFSFISSDRWVSQHHSTEVQCLTCALKMKT